MSVLQVSDIEIRRVVPEMEPLLSEFFTVLSQVDEGRFFQPHPFTREQAHNIAAYEGKDFYALVLYKEQTIGYGMLRGWDEGYETPSLGISIHPDFRGAGIGLLLMHYLHAVATLRGSANVRLRVQQDNFRARCLYEKLGYVFSENGEEFLVGFLPLKWR